MSRNITMKDVADEADVSVATVSNIINNKDKYVSPELVTRVKNAIKKLDYSPNKIARSLKINKSFNIGVLVPDITNPFFAEIVKGGEQLAVKNDYQILLYNTDGNVKREKVGVNNFLNQGVDGIINIAPRRKDSEIERYYTKNNIPMVIVDRPIKLKSKYAGVVFADNYVGSHEVAEHLFTNKKRKYICMAGPKNVPNVQKRIKGFVDGLEEYGISKEKIDVVYGKFNHKSGHDLMQILLNKFQMPMSIFICSDIMAWGAIEAIKDNKKIPEDISIVGFDNIYFSELLNPPLTTVNQPKSELGLKAVQLLFNIINGKESSKEIILKTNLVIRKTS